MDRRRLLLYGILDLAVWALAVWLLVGDSHHSRMALWHYSKRVSWCLARSFGAAGMYCEKRYNRLVGTV